MSLSFDGLIFITRCGIFMTAIAARELMPPLCVDLDGALIRSNLLLEALLRLVGRNPLYLFMAMLWLLRGRAILKGQVAARIELNPAALPYDSELLEWLRSERARGRDLWLYSEANERLATAVTGHLGIFEGVVGGNQVVGDGRFDYCDRERRDRARWRPLLRALRPHQWIKNVLLFVPLLAAHRAGNLAALATTLLAFVAFSLCASAVYILNDLLDLESDRKHPRKASRPFASGDATIASGLLLIPILFGAAATVTAFLPVNFRLVLGVYFALTLAYSLNLKRRVLLDAMALAALYTLRIIAGATATSIALSFWLLLFSVFLFLSLAFAKRFAELDDLRRQHLLHAAGRGYRTEDLPILRSMGTASGYLSVLVLALYINSPDVGALYHRPKVIWLLCIAMLYWISRLWVVAQRGKLHDDPVIYAMQDRVSLLTGLLAAFIIGAAI
jgi:4-hydroxybenzoate polyprenyltransferase